MNEEIGICNKCGILFDKTIALTYNNHIATKGYNGKCPNCKEELFLE